MTTYTAPPTQTHLVLNSGDTLNVEVNGLAYDTMINQGAVLKVASGGTVIGTTNNGGNEYVEGTDIGTTINSGNVYVDGTSTGMTINFGGTVFVEDGTVIGTTINVGGSEYDQGGTSIGTTINEGGTQYVQNGSTATNTIIDGKFGVEIVDGGTSVATTIKAGGLEWVRNGGTANNTIIRGGGVEHVFSSGTANTVIFAGSDSQLQLDNPSGLTGTIIDWHVGDIIDFLNTKVTGVNETGNTLSVTYGDHQTASYSLAGKQADTEFQLQSDGQGGTNLILQQLSLGSPPVTNIAELNAAILEANGVTAPGTFTIKLANNIDLGSIALQAINLHSHVTLDIEGAGHTLEGGGAQHGLFVYAGTVDINDLVIANMLAKGGDGGFGAGGGGAGLGGGLFVGSNVAGDPGNVTLSNVAFANNKAVGGGGGSGGLSYYAGGGGGGLGGSGGSGGDGGNVGGGGGGGVGGSGGRAGGHSGQVGNTGGNGGNGLVHGATVGGDGGPGGGFDDPPNGTGGAGGAGGASGGGGGGGGGGTVGGTINLDAGHQRLAARITADGTTGGGAGGGGGGPGGVNGAAGSPLNPNAASVGGGGGAGGFGGGGGGGAFANGSGGVGGIGGFGGGGGGGGFGYSQGMGGDHAYSSGGLGGFGGGGGGGNTSTGGSRSSGSIWGGGTGGSGSRGMGGGGLGAGGDIFVQAGALLTIDGTASSVGAGTVTGGAGEHPGQAFANGIYLQGNNTLTFSPTGTVTVDGVIGDDQGSAAAAHYGSQFYNPGNVAIAIDGTGTVQLKATNTYTGSTTLSGTATLELGVLGAAGSGTIKFGSGTNTLQIDSTTMPTNTIDQFGAGGDVIDLRGLPFVAGATAHYDLSTHILTVTSNSITETLTLTNVASPNFHVTNDGSGGTQVSLSLTTLVSFTGPDGTFPRGSLIIDAAGNLFGTTAAGGVSGQGTVFEIVNTPHGYDSTPTTVVSFNGPDGAGPQGSLIADAAGNLFGTTSDGGTSGQGTVFEIVNTPHGYDSTPITLVSFNGAVGAGPHGSLIANPAGNLFGTTSAGGTSGQGTVFEILNAPHSSTPTTLVSFNGPDGAGPQGSLIAVGFTGDLFGTTSDGGTSGQGTVFEIVNTPHGYDSTPITLVSFNGPDGAGPHGSLIADAAGNLFGTTQFGGASGKGTVFEITPTGHGLVFTTLVSFTGPDGTFPRGSLIIDAAGNLFGTTAAGGVSGQGTVFEIVKTAHGYASTPTTVVTFNGPDGANPQSSLIADAAGDLFGTTSDGGASGRGTVFEITGSGFVTAGLGSPTHTPGDVQDNYFGIVRLALPLDQATTVANAINAGTQTEAQYVSGLLSQASNTTIPAVAVEASMYGTVRTSAEVTSLATQFLPNQVAFATQHGLNAQVYASEALGLALAFGNETGSATFATNFGPSNAAMGNSIAGDLAFATAAATAIFGSASTTNLVNVIDAWVTNWKAFYTGNGLPGIANATSTQIDLAARGAAWGDAVGVALDNNLGPLKALTTNFLMDAAEGIASYSMSLVGQPAHHPFHGEI